jgi:ATP-dependent DNA helicase RecG
VIGTHALFQDRCRIRRSGAGRVDEQHRFGVEQRLALTAKGRGVDTLVMSATPIPRSLTLTAYGDMDVSRLDEKPPGRSRSPPAPCRSNGWTRCWTAVGRAIERGAKIYWVCPLIEESETSDLAAARQRRPAACPLRRARRAVHGG